MFEAYVDEKAMEKAFGHAKSASQQRKESMGLLAGELREWHGSRYVFVSDYLTAGNSATSVSVSFSEEAFPQLARQINDARKKNKIIVGWSHSHPSYGCFLSTTDLQTQRKYFSAEFNIAMVIDPVRKEKKVFKLAGGKHGYRESSFAVVQKRE